MLFDIWKIDKIISEDAYVVGFEKDGNVRTYNGIREEKAYNIFENSLEDILYAAAKNKGFMKSVIRKQMPYCSGLCQTQSG